MAGAGGSGAGNTQPIQDIKDMSAMGVFRLLDRAREYGEKLHDGPAPKKGYLDTQLFPDKKPAKAEE